MKKLQAAQLNRKSKEQFKVAQKTSVIVVLDNVRSAFNIGSVFRTADAFLIEAIYLCGISAHPPHKEIEKAALGATESVSWEYFKNTSEAVNKLISMNAEIWAVEQVEERILLNEFTPEKEKLYALIFGNEIKGVDQEVLNQSKGCIEIPQSGTKHSLNIAVSTGIVLWDFYKKLRL